MKVVSVVGARPQFIKMAAVSRAVEGYEKRNHQSVELRELVVHTGQHYDYELSKVFFEELHIPEPDYNLDVGSGSHGRQTGKMLEPIEGPLVTCLSGVIAATEDIVPHSPRRRIVVVRNYSSIALVL